MQQQFETTATALRNAVNAVKPIVERRNTIPILGSILIESGYVRSTNLDMEVRAAFGMADKVKKPFAVDCHQLARLAPHIDDDETITVTDGENLASITFNGSEYRLVQYNGSDFPDFDDLDYGAGEATGNAGILAAMRQVRFAVSNEETRYYLNGICLSTYLGKPCVVATDGHRAAIAEIPFLPSGANNSIVPRDLVDYLLSRKAEPERIALVEVQGKAGRIKVDFPGLSVKGKLIDGTYPDFTRVVPKDAKPVMTFDRAKMLKTLRRMMAFAAQRGMYGRPVKMTFATDRSGVDLEIRDADDGKGREVFSACAIEPQFGGFAVGFNAQYLIDVLSAFTGETISMREDDAVSPAVFTSLDDALTVVLMPMQGVA